MGTKLDEIMMDLDKGDLLTRIEVYEVLSKHPDNQVEILLKDAIAREQNEWARAYMILLWAELRKTIGGEMEEALAFIYELEYRKEIYESECCMISCYYAEYLLGNQSVEKKVENMLGSSDERVRSGVMYLLKDIRSGYAV